MFQAFHIHIRVSSSVTIPESDESPSSSVLKMAVNMPADHVPVVNLPSANVPAENVPVEQVRNSGVFPQEVWLKILPYVDKEDFRSLKLSCTVLHDLCDDPSIGWEKVSSFNYHFMVRWRFR
jgi:hypothetical protein